MGISCVPQLSVSPKFRYQRCRKYVKVKFPPVYTCSWGNRCENSATSWLTMSWVKKSEKTGNKTMQKKRKIQAGSLDKTALRFQWITTKGTTECKTPYKAFAILELKLRE